MNADDRLGQLLHLNRLLEIPEAGKLRFLDEEMTRTAGSQDMPIDAKIRKFEEHLAEYRQVMERIRRHGGTSILDQNYDTIVRKIVDAVLESQRQHKDDKAEENHPSDDLDSMEETTISEEPKIQSEMEKLLGSVLEKNGVEFVENKVTFPKITEGKRNSYAQSSFEKVVKYLTSENEQKAPKKLQQLTDLVFDSISNDIDEDMLRKFPNLRSLYIAKRPTLTGEWLEMK